MQATIYRCGVNWTSVPKNEGASDLSQKWHFIPESSTTPHFHLILHHRLVRSKNKMHAPCHKKTLIFQYKNRKRPSAIHKLFRSSFPTIAEVNEFVVEVSQQFGNNLQRKDRMKPITERTPDTQYHDLLTKIRYRSRLVATQQEEPALSIVGHQMALWISGMDFRSSPSATSPENS